MIRLPSDNPDGRTSTPFLMTMSTGTAIHLQLCGGLRK
jgi:hypothetical protein